MMDEAIKAKLKKVHDELNAVVQKALARYNKEHCPCCYPRFIQMVSIDCSDYRGSSFECLETEAFIGNSRPYFKTIEKEPPPSENYAEQWICKQCGSEFELFWTDFSISVNRVTLKPVRLSAPTIGRESLTPIPLYVNLMGHDFPSKRKIKTVGLEKFTTYMLE